MEGWQRDVAARQEDKNRSIGVEATFRFAGFSPFAAQLSPKEIFGMLDAMSAPVPIWPVFLVALAMLLVFGLGTELLVLIFPGGGR